MVWHNVEIARWIGIPIIDCGRDPLPIQRKCAKRSLDCPSRAQRMRVIALRPAHRNSLRMVAEHLSYRRRFGTVIELGRTGVRVDIIDLLGCEFRVRERFAHGANA